MPSGPKKIGPPPEVMNWGDKVLQDERRLRRRIFLAVGILLALALPALLFGRRAWVRYEQHRLFGQAQTYLQQNDSRKAVLCLRQIREINPDHLAATRLLAQLADQSGQPQAVSLWEKVCALAPESYDDALAWATSSLRHGDRPHAQAAIDIMARIGPQRAGYHFILGCVARDDGRLREAATQFALALKVEPDNARMQFEAASLQLLSPEKSERQKGWETMQGLRADPGLHLDALRQLANSAGLNRELETARLLTTDLVADPAATFADRLLHLTALHSTGRTEFVPYLAVLQKEAESDPQKSANLMSWLAGSGEAARARDWAATFTPEQVSTPPLAIRLAETYLALRDWEKLRAATIKPDWGEWEGLRLAYLSRALAETGDTVGSDVRWKAAIVAQSAQPERLEALAQLAQMWGWQARWEALLWYTATVAPRPLPALKSLIAAFVKEQNAPKLRMALASSLPLQPGVALVKNNWAMTALLTNSDVPEAAAAARELHEAEPADVHYAATYAFALRATGQPEAAVKVMRRFSETELSEPAVAAYFGLVLADLHDPEAARYLELAKAARLFPEERQLVEQARQKVKAKL